MAGPSLQIGCLLSVLVVAALSCASPGAEPPGTPEQVTVDREGGEIRFPCRFVSATQKLEVFACHSSGPTHETVVAFDAEGDQIYRALREVGFRGPEHWNATSIDDVRLVGGDRALVWIRWEKDGKVHEVPAEEILVEEGTGLPLFIRGFSFTAREVLIGDPPRPGIPRSVELTIGGTSRQSATFSMLDHVNDLPQMVNWVPAPEVSPAALPDVRDLVEKETLCSLVIRRLKGERELVKLALDRETDPRRRAVRKRQLPLADQIDAGKAEFESLAGEMQKVLAEGEGRKDLGEDEKKRFVSRATGLIGRAVSLAAGIRLLYLELWDLEEACRLPAMLAAATSDPYQTAWVEMAYRGGFRFELAIAAKRREIAALAESKGPAGGNGAPPAMDLLRGAIEKEIEALELERERRWAGFKLQHESRDRLKDLKPGEQDYLIRLFRESEMRSLADMRRFRAKAEAARADADEMRARAVGSAPGAEIARRRERAEALEKLASAELEQVEILEKLRWAEGATDPQAQGAEDPRRLEEESRRVAKRIVELRAEILKSSGREAGSGEDPPQDASGQSLFPPDVAG